MLRTLAVGAFLATLVLAGTGKAEERCDAPAITADFDILFHIADRRWMPEELRGQAWCLLKAQCYVESRLDPDAESGAGAKGLCQVLESTAGDFGLRGQLRDARSNVKAAALAWSRFWHVWATPRPRECRVELTLASYNAGPGNIIAAQKAARGALCWEKIRAALPGVTGPRARETVDYVSRFWHAWRELRGYGFN